MASVAPAVMSTSDDRVIPEPVETLLVGGHGLAQLEDARTRRILVVPGADGRHGGVGHLVWTIGVGESLPEIDGVGLGGEGGHLREYGGAEPLEPGVEIRDAIGH